MARTSPRFVDFDLENSWVVEYPTDTGRWLRFAPATIRARFRFAVLREVGEGVTLLSCRLRVADEGGHLWETDAPFTAAELFDALIDPSRERPGVWAARKRPILSKP